MADDERRVSDYDPKVGHTIADHGAKTISPGQAAVAAGNIQLERGWAAAGVGLGWADTGVARPAGNGFVNNHNGLEQSSMTRGWASAPARGFGSMSPKTMDSGFLGGAWEAGPIATRDASVPVPGTAPAAGVSGPAAAASVSTGVSAPAAPGAEP